MSSRAFAVIVLRLIGVWFLFEALFGLVRVLFFHQELMAGMAGVHRRWYSGSSQSLAFTPDLSLQDAYYVVSHFAPGLVDASLRLIAGGVLMFCSRPLARLLARNVDPI